MTKAYETQWISDLHILWTVLMASYISFKTSRVETGFSDFILDVLFFFFTIFFFSSRLLHVPWLLCSFWVWFLERKFILFFLWVSFILIASIIALPCFIDLFSWFVGLVVFFLFFSFFKIISVYLGSNSFGLYSPFPIISLSFMLFFFALAFDFIPLLVCLFFRLCNFFRLWLLSAAHTERNDIQCTGPQGPLFQCSENAPRTQADLIISHSLIAKKSCFLSPTTEK